MLGGEGAVDRILAVARRLEEVLAVAGVPFAPYVLDEAEVAALRATAPPWSGPERRVGANGYAGPERRRKQTPTH